MQIPSGPTAFLSAISRTLAVTALIAAEAPALAHDHNHPELDQWYGSLERPNQYSGVSRVSCCNQTDCHTTESELRHGSWWARLGRPPSDGEREWVLLDWVEVPTDAILKKHDNPTGEAVICHSLAWKRANFSPKDVTIYCFVPSMQY